MVIGDEMLCWGLIVDRAVDSSDVACESVVINGCYAAEIQKEESEQMSGLSQIV